jgi:5-(carboxyamino)imidazole ribonucleotide synthase
LDAADAPCAGKSEIHITGSLYRKEDMLKLANLSDILTFEIEHISMEGLKAVESSGKRVVPSSKTLEIIQDKGTQKQFYQSHQIPTTDFRLAADTSNWATLLDELEIEQQFVIKTRTGGYDGKGVEIAHRANLPLLLEKYINTPVVLEKPVDFTTELSVIVARDLEGNMQVYEPCEMVFDPVLNLVDTLVTPARISPKLSQLSKDLAVKTVSALEDAGIYAVEQFLTADGQLLVNETAPRPHNSGHHTIESCYSSQYDQLNRILFGWPLGNPSQKMPAAMINIIGPEGCHGTYRLSEASALLAIPGVYVHLYGKAETRPGRKLGHITILSEDMSKLEQLIQQVKSLVKII